jgi:hypothetical protein
LFRKKWFAIIAGRKTYCLHIDSPDFAALVTLSAQAQRGIVILYFFFFLSAKGGERVTSAAKSGE